MPSIDQTNGAIWTVLAANAALSALATGGVWDTKADDAAAFPNIVFQRVTGVPDYTFGKLSSEKQSYMLKAYARDTATETGRSLCAQAIDLAKAILLHADLVITGSLTLACYPTNDLPPLFEKAGAELSLDTYGEGFYFDVFAA